MRSFMKFLRPDGKWQCCAPVQHRGVWTPMRCEKTATINDTWCKIHDPVRAQRRKDASEELRKKQWAKKMKERFAERMYLVLRDIANKRRKDVKPADLAAEMIAEIDETFLD